MSRKKTKRPVGRPSKIAPPTQEPPPEQLPFDQVCSVMLAHAERGGFLSTVGAAFYREFGQKVTTRTLERLAEKTPEMKAIKALCKQLCSHYWDERLSIDLVKPAAWIFIKKNVDRWTDRVEQNGNINLKNPKDPKSMSVEELMEEAAKLMASHPANKADD